MADITIRIDEKEFCANLLDAMTKFILGDEEWDAYHQFRRAVNRRFEKEGYKFYLDYDCRHRYKKIEP